MKNIQIQTHGQQMLQTQSLSPLQVLVARLLGLTTIEMEERVRGEVIDNPALEVSLHDDSAEMDGNDEMERSITNEELIAGDYSNATEAELMDACKQFEAYFLEQVFKGMEKTIPKKEDGDTSTQNLLDYFKDSTIQQLAEDSTESNGLGLAQMLFEQMKRNYNIE